MITAAFLVSPRDELAGFTIQGHSETAESGADILCAAVSSAAYLVANTITEVLHVSPLSLRGEEGDMYLRLAEKDEPLCRDLLAGFRLHLRNLEEQYPENLRVSRLKLDQQQ